MEFSNSVTVKKIFKVYLQLHEDKNFEIIGDEEDRLICPFIWSAFERCIKGLIV